MKSGFSRWLLPLLIYTLLFGVFSWPLAAHFTTGFLGFAGHDANQYVWNAYNFRQALAAGKNPFFTDLLLYPQGSSLIMHTYTPIIGLLNSVLNQPILAVNVALLLSFVLSGVGAYRLCGRWVANPVLCLLAGVVFAFSPYKLAHLPEHYHLLLTAAVPFYAWAFLEAFQFETGRLGLRVRRWSQVAVCAALGFVTLLSDYYTLFGLLYFSLGYALYYWCGLGQINWRRPRPWLILVLTLVVCHIGSRLLGLSGVPDNAGFWWGGDLAGYLLPPTTSRWLSTAFTERLLQNSPIFNMPGSVENVMFLGYCLPLLLLLTLLLRRPKAGLAENQPSDWAPLPWLLLLFFMLTLPAVRVFGKEILRLPTGLVHYLPFLNNIRCPTRHVSYVALLLPLVLFARLDPWLRARLQPAGRWAFSGALLGLVLIEFQPAPAPLMDSTAIPRAYREVAQLPGDVLFPIPFGLLDGYQTKGVMNSDELLYQTIHHKKIPGAYISRIPQATFHQFDQDPVMHALLQRQTFPDSALVAVPTAAQVSAFLRRYQPAAFLVHPDYRNQPVHTLLRELLRGRGYQEREVDGYVLLHQPTPAPH
ncbi:hypothetical protein SAMN02745146_2893 [Hymenobacter daecheongensis DSM 21074]|uniref:DUF6311 domain-containing protein n=1 Tax=Hymenobacter daecheongensis DSM 21074 TaxID=1121955 RepID=A0A1M6IM78_9BACT|nr:hypothetical protein [Hymenobacter daecheongensis]SHJ35459.1 hypothetical protein SAMN02745146_2893 [Hymenobacter daecheongensis DSM 21074]